LRAEKTKPDSGSVPIGRLAPWLPVLLVFGGSSLSWLPSQDAALNAVFVGAYLTYAAAVTVLHFLPWLSDKLS
jgi:hypothetical protein